MAGGSKSFQEEGKLTSYFGMLFSVKNSIATDQANHIAKRGSKPPQNITPYNPFAKSFDLFLE